MPERSQLDDDEARLLCAALGLGRFFDAFTVNEAGELFPHGGLFAYAVGETVMRQGEPGKDLYVLCSGRLAVEQDKGGLRQQINEINPGEIFGEIGLLKDGIRSATAAALEESLVFRVTRGDLAHILEHHPELGEHLKALASQRI